MRPLFKPNLPFLVSALAAVGCCLPAPARAEEDDAAVYEKLLRSVVLVKTSQGSGSGSLIDRQHRLILTVCHGVLDAKAVEAVFPLFDRADFTAGREPGQRPVRTAVFPARVVACDQSRDLAVIQVHALPDTAVPLPLATSRPESGQTVHSIGNPSNRNGLWVYTPGKVQGAYCAKWTSRGHDHPIEHEAEVVDTDAVTSPGDCGGPLVSDQGELLGVFSTHHRVRALSRYVSVIEVKKLLAAHGLASTVGVKSLGLNGTGSAVIRDDGGLFGTEAIEKATAQLRSLAHNSGCDLVIETRQPLPNGELERLRGMSQQQRVQFFRGLVSQRLEAEAVRGVLVLIWRTPPHLEVRCSGRDGSTVAEKVGEVLVAHFKQDRFDEGLLATAACLRDSLDEKGAR